MVDKYESEYMAGGEALFAEKHVSRWFAGLMLGIAGTTAALGFIDPSVPALLTTGVAAFAVALPGVYFSVMRVTVTEGFVRVQYGTLGPKIDLQAIEKTEIVKLGASKFLFGPKIWPEGWRYVPPGADAGVRIHYHDGKKQRAVTIGATDAEALRAAIEQARAANGPTRVQVRVDDKAMAEEVEVDARDDQEGSRQAR